MPPITAFYTFIAGTVLIGALGSSPQMSVGADSTIAPLFAVGIAHLALPDSSNYIDLVGILAVFVGVIVALVGLLRLGWIAEIPFRSDHHRLPRWNCSHHRRPPASRSVRSALDERLDPSPHRVHAGTPRPDQRLGTRHRSRHLRCCSCRQTHQPQIPRGARALVGSTVVVAIFGLPAHGVSVLGAFAHGAPHFGLVGLSWSALGSVAPIAAVVALVVLAQSAATSRAFADEGDYEVDVGRDFIGVGAGISGRPLWLLSGERECAPDCCRGLGPRAGRRPPGSGLRPLSHC